MSIWAAIESEFNSIIADARSVPEKLAALVDLHGKAQGLAGIETAVTTIIEDTTKATEEKVTAIMQAVGKL
jgi:hypothetical protein